MQIIKPFKFCISLHTKTLGERDIIMEIKYWFSIFFLVLVSFHPSNARNVPSTSNDVSPSHEETTLLHATSPKEAESPTAVDDKKNFIYGGVGGFAGIGGYAGVAGVLPTLGGIGTIGKFGGIGGVGGIGGGIGGLGGAGGLGGVGGVGGVGGGVGDAGGAAGAGPDSAAGAGGGILDP